MTSIAARLMKVRPLLPIATLTDAEAQALKRIDEAAKKVQEGINIALQNGFSRPMFRQLPAARRRAKSRYIIL